MASTREGYLSIKKETNAGVAVKPTHPLRFQDGDMLLIRETIKNSPIQNNRAKNISASKGKINSEGSYNVVVDPNEIVYWLHGALGGLSSADISSETDASVYRHTINAANDLPSYSIEQGKGNLDDTTNNRQNYEVSRAFGAVVDMLKLSASDGDIMAEVSLKSQGIFQKASLIRDAAAGSSVAINVDTAEGLVATDDTVNISDLTPQNESDAIASLSTVANTITIASLANTYTVANRAKIELQPQTPSYSTAQRPFTFHMSKFQFGDDLTEAASATETNVEDWELTYNNNIQERYGSKRASPSVVAPTGYEADMSFTMYFESVQERDWYLDLTQRALIITITDNVIVSATDTAQVPFSIIVKIPDFRFTAYELPTANDDHYAAKIEGSAFYDASAGYKIRIEVVNGKAGTVYTA